jgi:RPA family protein
MSEQFKRNIAYKCKIGDLLIGNPIFSEEKFVCIELGDKKLSRVNIIGNIIDRYDREGEKQYTFFTFDDGSGQIKLKTFGEDSEKFKGIESGETVVVIGVVRNFNNETYIAPEIIQPQDTKYLLIRKLELEKERASNAPPTKIEREESSAIREKILEKIKESEEAGGIDLDALIIEFKEISPDIINQEVQKFLEEGIAFEPRPGRIRYLG